MNFESILKYQKADLEYKQLNDEIAGNPDYRKMRVSKKAFDAAKQRKADSETLAGSVMGVYGAANDYLSANVARANELCARLGADDLGEEEEKELLVELENLRSQLGEWEKKLSSAKASADKAIAETRAANESGKAARSEFEAAKKNFEAFKSEKELKLAELKAAREKLEPAVEPALLNLYKSLTAENKYPALVAAAGDDKNPVCGACGMSLAEQVKNDLKSNGYCRCETCGRVIYKL